MAPPFELRAPTIAKPAAAVTSDARTLSQSFDESVERRAKFLAAYQNEAYAARIAQGLVAFEIVVETLAGKLKLNQNRNPGDWAAVVERFGRSEDAAERETATLMSRVGPPR